MVHDISHGLKILVLSVGRLAWSYLYDRAGAARGLAGMPYTNTPYHCLLSIIHFVSTLFLLHETFNAWPLLLILGLLQKPTDFSAALSSCMPNAVPSFTVG